MVELLPLANNSEVVQPSEALLAECLEQICGSPAFEGSATLRNLLRYLFEHRNQQVSEYTIAVEALRRNTNFDPQVDATVRVQISRLRRRLKEHYLSEGAPSGIRFSIPLGTHQLVFEFSEQASSALQASTSLAPVSTIPLQSETPRAEGYTPTVYIITLLSVLVVGLSGLCLWQQKKLHTTATAGAAASRPPLLPLWKEFLGNGKSSKILLPNPIFFSWQIRSADDVGLIVRDTAVNDFQDMNTSPRIELLKRAFGEPSLAQYYTVSSDVLAATQLMHFLLLSGQDVDIAISSDTATDIFEKQNVILIGTAGTLAPFRSFTDQLDFQFNAFGSCILNGALHQAEPRRFNMVQESANRTIYPGLIAYIPGTSKKLNILIIEGRDTSALVDYLTSSRGSAELDHARSQSGHGPFFEAVVMSEVEGYTVLQNHLAAFRPYTAKAVQNQ